MTALYCFYEYSCVLQVAESGLSITFLKSSTKEVVQEIKRLISKFYYG